MTAQHSNIISPVPPERLAEAGVWIARLHGEHRGAQLEAGFREWLGSHSDNVRAFELATEVWDDAHGLRRIVPLVPVESVHPPRRPLLWGAVAAAICVIVVGIASVVHSSGVTTGIGEQRLLALEDGTRVFLNTQTRVVVHYDEQARRIELKRGEAWFDVAKRPDWPFTVTAGERQVKALGTSFLVRRDEDRLAVTLVEGKVAVLPVTSERDDTGGRSANAQGDSGARGAGANLVDQSARKDGTASYTLTAGERITISVAEGARLDRPSMEKATAWRRGQVVLDDTPLADAVAEMNRYNTRQIVVAMPEARALLVNGLFQAGDSMSFANAVARTYGLTVIEAGRDIVVAGAPVQR